MKLGDEPSDGNLPTREPATSQTSSDTFECEDAANVPRTSNGVRRLMDRCWGELTSSLGPDQLGQLSLVTHLTIREIKTIDTLFCLLVELSLSIGEDVRSKVVAGSAEQGTPRAGDSHEISGPSDGRVWALTARQLRRLPEFAENVFLERLIRVISESGEDALTLLELIDLYSAFSSRASFEWKAWVLFCVFDYDEDGMLDSGDIYRAIRQMIVMTHSVRFTSTRRPDAAVLIQKHFRGRHARKVCAVMRAQEELPPIRPMGRSSTFTEAYTRKILHKCQSVKHDVMDFRYFESVLRKCPEFGDHFRITMCKPRKVERLLHGDRLATLAKHDADRFHRVQLFVNFEEGASADRIDEHTQQTQESTANPLHRHSSESDRRGRNDVLARRVKKLDRRIERAQHEFDLKKEADDYDETWQRGDGLWKPYGVMGTELVHGMRPPVLATRLRWIGLDMRMLRMLSGKGDAQTHVTTNRSDDANYEAEGVERILHEFKINSRASITTRLVKYVMRRLEKMHHGLWGHTLADISHKHGAGIMELASIMKWMLLLNFALGFMWMILVIVPRDFDAENSMQVSVFIVVSAMLINGSDTERNLYYDGFQRKQGVFEHMDFFYFTAIMATIVISLAAMLRKLGTAPIGGKSKVKNVAADAGMEWASILGAYDFTQVDRESASKMRQTIRGKIEDWHADRAETLLLEKLENATWSQHAKHIVRLRTGAFMTYVLLFIYGLAWFWMLNNETELKQYHVLLAPAILATLNASSPPIIKFITLFEHRAKSIDVMEACVKRIFRVKIVQLLTIYYTIFKIMSSVHVQLLRQSTERSNSPNSTEEVTKQERLLDGIVSNSTSYDECPEARSGAIFLHQLVMDAVVFIAIQYSYLYMVKIGFPNLLVWRSTVRNFSSSKGADKNGYRLQRRLGDVAVQGKLRGSAFEFVFSSKSARKTRKEMRWYMLEPHKHGRWYKQGIISILLEHFIHQATRHGADTEAAKYQVLAGDLPRWRDSVAKHQANHKDEILKTDFRAVARKVAHLGFLDDLVSHHPRDQHLKENHQEVKKSRRQLARAIAHKSEVFSTMDLDVLSEKHLLDTASRTEVDKEQMSEFSTAAQRFKEEAAYRMHELTDLDTDSAQFNVSGLDTTKDEFVQQIEEAMRDLARYVVKFEETDRETMKQLLAARPRHRERRRCGCCCRRKHKTSAATKLRLERRAEETDDQYQKRKGVTSLLKADVQYAAATDNVSPLHKLRTVLTAIPASQLCLMVEAIRETDSKDASGILTDSISLDQASSWRYHRFYLNQSIRSWVEGITIPLYMSVKVAGEMTKRHVHNSLNRKTQDAIVNGLANMDIHTVGELIHSEIDDDALRMVVNGALGERLPMYILRHLRKAQGDWTDVTQAVEQKRWIRLPPTELKHDESASLIIGMLWRQVFVWAGTPFCPWLPMIACVLQILMFTALQHCLLYGRYLPPQKPWAVGATTQLFMRFGMQTLLLCVLPITMWLNGVPACGPHAGIQIASTYAIFEEEVLVSMIDERFNDGNVEFIRLLYYSLSFIVHYLMNSTFLLLIVFVMWTRGRTRMIQLSTEKSRVNQLQKQMKLDAGYLHSRLREVKRHSDKQEEKASIHLEQQKMHQYIMSTMGMEMKIKSNPSSLKERAEQLAQANTKDAFSNIVTRIWPLSEHHGIAQRRWKHMPVIWMMQDASVDNFTQFTIRVNDTIVVPPKLQRNDLCGEVPGEDHVLMLEFNMPEEIMSDTMQDSKVQVTITAPDASCSQRLAYALPKHPVPKYQYACELIHDDKRTLLRELQDFEGSPDIPINGISYGDIFLNQTRWSIRVPIYREVAHTDDHHDQSVSDNAHVVEFQVELLKCTVEEKDEAFNDEFGADSLEKLTHTELLKQASAAGVDKETIAAHRDRTGSYQREKLIEEIVLAEPKRPKGKKATVIARYRLGTRWHRYSHFFNLYNALATCLSKKDLKKLPAAPLRHHEYMHLFTAKHHGHMLEERRKNLETFMQDLLSNSTTKAYLNPYFLGFLGMFSESTVYDVEEDSPYLNATRWRLRHGVHEAAIVSRLESSRMLTSEPAADQHGLESISSGKLDQVTLPGIEYLGPDNEPEPEPSPGLPQEV